MLNRLLPLFVLLMLFVSPSFAGLIHDSELSWVTAESEHFRIHYHDDEKQLADRSLQIAESVYARLTPELDWHPVAKTEIVLSDETDSSNGFAMPLPSNRMTLFVSQPHSVNSLEDHAGWLETLILHEFVHILHLDKALGGPKHLRRVFGRFFLLFPNVFMPPWMHEGLATYYETDKQLGIGRGQSSYFQMMMRMEVKNGIKSLRHVNQPMVRWPLLTSRYLYGVYFNQFIAETYGAEKLPAIVAGYSRYLVPFRINTIYKRVLGKDLSQLWDEFTFYLDKRFQPQLTKLEQAGLVEGEALTQTGDFKNALLETDDGRIFFTKDHLQSGSHLMVIKGNEKAEEFSELNWGASLDWHQSSGLLIAQPDLCNNANSFYDLYHMDDQTGKQSRLTKCKRYISATWSADGKSIAAVHNYRGQHAVHLLNENGELQEVLWQGKDGQTLSGLDWSDDGLSLVSSVWRKGTGWNIEEFDLSAKNWQARTADTLIKTDALYVKGSRDIVFSMDAEGIYNAFRLKGETGEIIQLSHVAGGLFSPFITQDNQLLSINYNVSGFDVIKLAEPQTDKVEGAVADKKWLQAQIKPVETYISEPLPYSPWQSLQPTSWFPSFLISNQGVELGALVSGADVLNRHNFGLYAGYQSVSQTPVFALDYIYDRWLPLLKLHAEQIQDPLFDKNSDLIALVENQRFDAELILPLLSEKKRWSAHLGINHQTSELAWLHPAYISTGNGYQDSLAGAALAYDSRESYPRAVSNVSSGSLWSLLFESGESLGGDYQGQVTSVSGRNYFDLSNEHVLAMRMDAAQGSKNSRPFYLGGSRGDKILPAIVNPITTNMPFNQRRYSLRGYGEGEAQLSGQNMALFSAEYRFPFYRIERGWMAPPVGIDQIYGKVFVDVGRAWDVFDLSKTYTGVGTEFGLDAVLFYNLLLRMQIGYAQGLDDTIGGNQLYFRLGSAF